MEIREEEVQLPKEGKAKQQEWEVERAEALRRGVGRANVMQECQLQMEWGIYSAAIMVNGLDCTTRGVVGVGVEGDSVWCYYSTAQQIRSADTSNGLDRWGYLRKRGWSIWRQGGWEDQGVSANGTVGTMSARVQPCACVRVVRGIKSQSPKKK